MAGWRAVTGAALIVAAIGPGGNAAQATYDAKAGKAAFVRQCALCHTIGKGEPNRYGPNLFGILDRKAASVPDFGYSPAFKSTASWNWSADALAAFISSPKEMVPGSAMAVFQGVADNDRDDILAYLASQK